MTDKEEITVCKLRKKTSVYDLFLKSFTYFVLVNAVVLTLAKIYAKIFGNPLMVFFIVGNSAASLATYYKLRMSLDSNYKPDCNCYNENETFSETAMNGILTVFNHKKGTLFFNIPNSVFGIFYYSFLIILYSVYGECLLIKVLVSLSCLGSLALWYIMVTEVRSICILCTIIHAVNFLSFYSLMF